MLPVFVGLCSHRKPHCAGEGSAKGERRRSLDDEDRPRRRGWRETVAGDGNDGEEDEDDGGRATVRTAAARRRGRRLRDGEDRPRRRGRRETVAGGEGDDGGAG